MALVLNGDGNITGLSAGGLPDGSVTADDIASTLDLSGKTVTLPAGGTGYGKVLQVVSTSGNNLETSTTSSSFVTTNISASITPSSTSSKILIRVMTQLTNTTAGGEAWITLYRNGTTNLAGGSNETFGLYRDAKSGTANYIGIQAAIEYLDSPSTTSSTTYTVYLKKDGTGTAFVAFNGFTTTITLMEIAA